MIGAVGGLLLTLGLGLALSKGVSARYTPLETITYVEIEGINYGTFEQIQNLRDLTSASEHGGSYTRVTLKRDFVTDPSMYLWARNTFQNRAGLTDINLVMRTSDGQEVSRYTLKYCKPLSWTVEAADPALGGFHENIELAVQEIAVD